MDDRDGTFRVSGAVLQGSISNYLGWKNWGLSFNLSYSIGSKIRLFRLYPNQGVVNGPEQNLRRELVNRWRRPEMS